MSDKVEFNYVAQPPNKGNKKLGRATPKPMQLPDKMSIEDARRLVAQMQQNKAINPQRPHREPIVPVGLKDASQHEQEIMNRVLSRTRLPNMAWDSLIEALKNKESKDLICRNFGIKPADLKYIKRYLGF
jgi:hypothetical protein